MLLIKPPPEQPLWLLSRPPHAQPLKLPNKPPHKLLHARPPRLLIKKLLKLQKQPPAHSHRQLLKVKAPMSLQQTTL
jgi:hypothetical protein